MLLHSQRKRVVRFAQGNKPMAFTEPFDVAWSIKYDFDPLFENEIPIKMFKASLSLYAIMTKATVTANKRMIAHLQSV